MEENLTSQIDAVNDLTNAIKAMGDSIAQLKAAKDECAKQGLSDTDIRDEIMKNIPEEDRAAFAAQWPMLSMMLAAM